MSTFNGVNGQSLFDVCLNCYGGLDNYYKLLQDSDVENADVSVKSNQLFNFDAEQIIDESVNRTTTLSGILFATAAGDNGNTFYVVIENGDTLPPPTDYTPPNNNTNTVSKTYKTSQTQYVATSDGESVISLPSLTGTDIFAIEKEIKPLATSDFNWNKNTGVLTLLNGISLGAGETLFIYYQTIVTI